MWNGWDGWGGVDDVRDSGSLSRCLFCVGELSMSFVPISRVILSKGEDLLGTDGGGGGEVDVSSELNLLLFRKEVW